MKTFKILRVLNENPFKHCQFCYKSTNPGKAYKLFSNWSNFQSRTYKKTINPFIYLTHQPILNKIRSLTTETTIIFIKIFSACNVQENPVMLKGLPANTNLDASMKMDSRITKNTQTFISTYVATFMGNKNKCKNTNYK